MFDLSRIAAAAPAARLDYHPSLGSTNDRALVLASTGDDPLPLLVLAERQTAGRGRGANRWLTSDGALTFSLALAASAEKLPAERQPQVAIAAGLAVCEALTPETAAGAVQVKWPNDVYLAGRKLGGILCESVPGWRDRLVVGIGVNVNNRVREPADLSAAPPLVKTATSLIENDGLARDMTSVLLAILDQFERRWNELLDGRFAAIVADYRRHCLLSEKSITIEQTGGRRLGGLCQGIDDAGALRLWTEAGEQRVYSGSVVEWELP